MQEILKRTTQVKRISKYNYLITINNIEYKLHIETILKYNLLSSNINYTNEEIIKFDNEMRMILDIDKYFIKYPKSVNEAIYIIVHKYNICDYEAIINRLLKLNILNDELLRNNIIMSLNNRLYGPNYINNILYKRGLDANYKVSYNLDELIFRFDKLLKRKNYSNDKIYRYLLTKGYSINDITYYLNNIK